MVSVNYDSVNKSNGQSYGNPHTLEDVLARLPSARVSGEGWKALCPAHDDKTPSLSVSRGYDAAFVLHCYAGCSFTSIMAALFPSNGSGHTTQSRIVATYDYTDEQGVLLYQAVRYQPKRFTQRRPDGQGGYLWRLGDVRRVLYHLGEVLAADTVIVVEGEKDADRLRNFGLTATTNAGGAKSPWLLAYSQALAGKQVVIIPDNDEAGAKHGQEVARAVVTLARSVTVIHLPVPAKGDVSDWLDAGHTVGELAALVEVTPVFQPDKTKAGEADTFHAYHTPSPQDEENPLYPLYAYYAYYAPPNREKAKQDTFAPWPKLEKEALYGLAGDIVAAIDPHTEADPVSVLLNTLTAFGNAINANPYMEVGKDKHYARLFTVMVGKSSKGRKGTGWSIPRYLFSLADPDWERDCIKGGLSSGEGLIYNVRDALYKKQPIKEKGRVIDYENVMVEEAITDKRLLIVESEFASTLTVMKRDGNSLSPVIRDAWDREYLATLTKNSPVKATGAHISILAHISMDELVARMDDTSKANGFANRFLFPLVRRSKELPSGGHVQEEDLQELALRLAKALDFARTVAKVIRDEDAEAMWREIYSELSAEKGGMVGAILARAESQVLRLSLLYALMDRSDMVKKEHIKAALALWDYCERSATIIFGERLGDPTADRILEALRAAGHEGMTEKQIYDLFSGHVSTNERTRALNLLAQLGHITSEQQDTGGRPRTVWRTAY